MASGCVEPAAAIEFLRLVASGSVREAFRKQAEPENSPNEYGMF
jgi:hypothetical protein